MKQLCLFVVLLIQLKTFAQDQYPFLGENKLWKQSYEYIGGGTLFDEELTILGDTLINGFDSKIIRDAWDEIFILAEFDKKVYYMKPGYQDEFTLLYDFNLEVNDTFNFTYYDWFFSQEMKDGQLKVHSVDTIITLNGQYRKRISLDVISPPFGPICFFNPTWVDGIGDISVGPLYLNLECFEQIYDLKCYSEDGIYVYGQCGPDGINDIDKVSINIYPNPFCNEVNISSQELFSKIRLFDTHGQLREEFIQSSNSTISFENLESGLYILSLETKNGKMINKRIVMGDCN